MPINSNVNGRLEEELAGLICRRCKGFVGEYLDLASGMFSCPKGCTIYPDADVLENTYEDGNYGIFQRS